MKIRFGKVFKLSFLLMLSVAFGVTIFSDVPVSAAVKKTKKSAPKFQIDKTGALTGYEGDAKNVVIPGNVKSISFGAFMEHGEIESVTLPEGLLTIDECAFYGCDKLVELKLPNSLVHIGRLAFGNCMSLQKIHIGDNLSDIMELFVCGCANLSEIEVSENNEHFTAEANILYDKSQKSLIMCPQKTSGKVCIPESVVTIKEHAFLECGNIEEIMIGKNVKYIDEAAFYGCKNLRKIHANEELRKIRSYAFAQCDSLKKITLGENVNYVGNGAFFECDELRRLVCLSKNIEFGEDVFDDGLDLTIYAPSGSNIEEYALKNRYNFENL